MNDDQQNINMPNVDAVSGQPVVDPTLDAASSAAATPADAPSAVPGFDVSSVQFDVPMKDPVNVITNFPNEDSGSSGTPDFPSVGSEEASVPEVTEPVAEASLGQDVSDATPKEDSVGGVDLAPTVTAAEGPVPDETLASEPAPAAVPEPIAVEPGEEAEDDAPHQDYADMLEEHLTPKVEEQSKSEEPAEEDVVAFQPSETDVSEGESVEDALRNAVEAREEVSEAKKRAREEVEEAETSAKEKAEEVVELIDEAIDEASAVIKKRESDLDSLISIQKNEINELHKRVANLRKKRTEMRKYLGLTEKDKK